MPHHRTLGGWTTWARTEPRLDRHPSTASPRIGQKSGRKLVWAPGVTTRLHLWNDKVCVSLSRLHLMLSKVVEVNKARNPGVVLPSLDSQWCPASYLDIIFFFCLDACWCCSCTRLSSSRHFLDVAKTSFSFLIFCHSWKTWDSCADIETYTHE